MKRNLTMNIQTSTLRPGLLVSLKTSVAGNVRYTKVMLQTESREEGGGPAVARWETTRTIIDPVEHDLARKVQSVASGLIRRTCKESNFGLLCPEADAESLDAAVAEARKLVADFNATAKRSRVYVYVISGRIAPTDREAISAINSEVSDLLATMKQGLENLDVKQVRDAASRMKKIGTMLTPEMEARTKIAVDAAREAARKITKAGEQAAQEIDRQAIRRISEARTAFLDLSGGETEEDVVAAPQTQGRAIDLDTDSAVA
jgi:hypothetical protein